MQIKSAVMVAMTVCLVLLLQGLVFAGETTYRFDLVTQTSRAMEFKNLWAGYKLFQGNCKSCHFRGNEKGAKFLDAESRTMRGWNSVFYKKNAQCAKDGSWANLSPEDLLAVNDYLYSKAYDTWDPRSNKSCG